MLPSRIHAIVLVSKMHKPTLRALAYARAMRPDILEAVTVSVDPAETHAARGVGRARIPVPLKVLDSPFREVTGRHRVRRRDPPDNPRDLVTVFIPEYVVGHWWEHLLHNQSALRLKGRLLFTPGVMVTTVPWQLQVAELSPGARGPGPRSRRAPGDVRRGRTRSRSVTA